MMCDLYRPPPVQYGDANEVLNSRAVEVMKRMSDKLMGRDFVVEGGVNPMESDSVAAQVWEAKWGLMGLGW